MKDHRAKLLMRLKGSPNRSPFNCAASNRHHDNALFHYHDHLVDGSDDRAYARRADSFVFSSVADRSGGRVSRTA